MGAYNYHLYHRRNKKLLDLDDLGSIKFCRKPSTQRVSELVNKHLFVKGGQRVSRHWSVLGNYGD